ncbi:hypothetical protein CPB83DRAFT_791721 [Crepidotus variabilis]|uniref:Uncharacterized protein n=1 Tax=Crepidotus variabilis TaxID=179855 RepID=A0A9P6JQ97_9AGAR|nr:hypothetical protein CPB83DRAFT_791721 [Crepidotus variabilis]
MLYQHTCRSFCILALLLVSSSIVTACEGECIVGITNAFVGNYSDPVARAMQDIATELDTTVLDPARNDKKAAIMYLQPLWDQYREDAHDKMQTAVFKNYFHGKCQDPKTNIDPPGCPNPDCPVVCGTPGSMVHFYSTLRYIAFNCTARLLESYITSNSPAYQKVESTILADSKQERRRGFRFRRDICQRIDGCEPEDLERRSEKSQIRALFMRFFALLAKKCGGQDGKLNGLPYCSWEVDMKHYILSFP